MSYLSKPFLIFLPLLSYLGVVLLLSPHITQAAGNTYYVRTGGQGSCGSAQTDNDASAVSSIQAGVNCIQGPGDTVIVHGGTYGSYGQNMNIPDISGNSSNRITLRAAGDGTVWMRGQLQFPFQTAQFWTVDGINIDGGYWPNNCANITESSSQSIPCRNVVMTSGSNNRFANMEVMHASYYGIEAGDNNTFIKVRSHDHGNDPQTLCRGNPATAGGQCHGFYTHDLNNVFDGVESYNNNGQGIALTLGSASVTVKNSKLHDNTGMAIQFAYAWTNHLIFNNLIYNNGSGFAVFASDSSQFYNNTIVGNGSCIDLVTDENGNGSDNNTLRNNICYQNGSTIFDQGSGNVQSNNLTTNPNFVNASNGDFHITSNSPARDAGTALSQVPCDHDGNARPAGSAYDIGAYEYGSSPGRRMFRLNIITDPHTSSVRCYLYAIHEQQPDTPRVWSPLGRDEPERDAGERELHPTHVIAQSGGPEYDEDGVCIQDGVCSPEWSIKLESGGPLRFPAAIRGMVSLISPGSDEYS